MLAVLDHFGNSDRIAIADLHSWVLILKAIRPTRIPAVPRLAPPPSTCHQRRGSDTALAFFSPARDEQIARYQAAYDNRPAGMVFLGVVAPFGVPAHIAVRTLKPANPEQWRRQFQIDANLGEVDTFSAVVVRWRTNST